MNLNLVEVFIIKGNKLGKSIKILLLLLIANGFLIGQCYQTENAAFSIGSTGDNQDSDYTTKYLLTDYNDIILEISDDVFFTGQESGLYKVLSVNYENGSLYDPIEIGQSIVDIQGSCLDISNTLSINICSDNCDIFDGIYNFSSNGENSDFDTRFILVDENFTIIDISLTPDFVNIPTGDFLIFAVNYSDGINLTNGLSLDQISGSCFDISNPLALKSCDNCEVFLSENFEICDGLSVLLSSNTSSVGNVSWSTGQIGPGITVSPSSTETYSVTFTSNDGCIATDNITVFVLDNPEVSIIQEDTTICVGSELTFSAESAENGSYSWTTGQTQSTINVSPTSSTSYTVIFTSLNGCQATDNVDVEVVECGEISGNVSIDEDGDDIGDVPVDRIVLHLVNEDDKLIATATTNVDGDYVFSDVLPGVYFVSQITEPEGDFSDVADFDFTPDPDGDDGEVPNDQIYVELTPGESDSENNFVERENIPLPVQYLYISGTWNMDLDVNEIRWATSIEINTSHFILERSFENSNFEEIARIDAAGNSIATLEYQYDDPDISQDGNYFYRLKLFDLDGSFDNSLVISIRVLREIDLVVDLYPNPSIYKQVNISITSNKLLDLNVTLLDITGKLIKEFPNISLPQNSYKRLGISLENIPAGVYLLSLNSESISQTHKLLIVD